MTNPSALRPVFPPSLASIALGLAVGGCNAEREDPSGADASHGIDTLGAAETGSAPAMTGGSMEDVKLDAGVGSLTEGLTAAGDGADGGENCTADLAGTMLQPVYLAFAFDVSGSMGKLDYEWHDPELKWEPVVTATKAYFADTSSSGTAASLTFFPAEDDRCDAETYAAPDVPMTALPSPAFGEAIDEVTPQSSDDWRGGTPTLAVTQAILEQLEALADDDPAARYVYVLVSDGYPQGCDDEADDIQSTIDAVAASSDRILTYVVGVQNPPGGPDTVTDLDAIAVAGGTDEAFIVQTGDPEMTAASFMAAIESIRRSVFSCSVAIPETTDGQPFDPTKVNVSYGGTPLGYDAACELPQSWRYDDEGDPSAIELCAETCAEVQQDAEPDLTVEFGCDTRPALIP